VKARKRPNKVNPTRKAKRFAEAYHSVERVLFVQNLECVACLFVIEQIGPSVNAHVGTGGAGLKAGYANILPLCDTHHQKLHAMGRATFERGYLLDLYRCAESTEALWRAHLAEDGE
jgi:hypothetical protein